MPLFSVMESAAGRPSTSMAIRPQRARIVCSASAAPAAPAKLKPDWAGASQQHAVPVHRQQPGYTTSLREPARVETLQVGRPDLTSGSCLHEFAYVLRDRAILRVPGEEQLLSKLVNAAIQSPLYPLMKVMAKRMMKRTAEGRGVPWGQNIEQLTARLQELEAVKAELEDRELVYPEYYLQPFHAYKEGNLGWQPAFEVEAATTAMALRVYKDEPTLQPEAAMDRLRGAVIARIQEFRAEHQCPDPADILDVGCSAGIGTRRLADAFPAAHVTGLDPSPHFLAVAEFREREHTGMTAGERPQRQITYRHALGEATGLPAASMDLVTLQFVIHECPQRAIEALVREARRLLRPKGVLAIVDNDPRSPVIQNLPPALFILMKSTEPWSDEYYSFDVEACMRAVGFSGVRTQESDPRHRVVLGLA